MMVAAGIYPPVRVVNKYPRRGATLENGDADLDHPGISTRRAATGYFLGGVSPGVETARLPSIIAPRWGICRSHFYQIRSPSVPADHVSNIFVMSANEADLPDLTKWPLAQAAPL